MRNPFGGNLLIGSLLDRLGHAQAQALLARLDTWLSQNERDGYPRTIERSRERTGNYYVESRASRTPKETQS
jgi:hypothetical protein